MNIRKAKKSEFEILTNIAISSEGYWGYDSSFMERFKTIYALTEEFICNSTTFIMEENSNSIGFYSILKEDCEVTLEYFYIEPNFIGKGYGKLLWIHMIKYCMGIGTKEIVFVTSPQAKKFYIKMGAVEIGEEVSLVNSGRIVPKLAYKISGNKNNE